MNSSKTSLDLNERNSEITLRQWLLQLPFICSKFWITRSPGCDLFALTTLVEHLLPSAFGTSGQEKEAERKSEWVCLLYVMCAGGATIWKQRKAIITWLLWTGSPVLKCTLNLMWKFHIELYIQDFNQFYQKFFIYPSNIQTPNVTVFTPRHIFMLTFWGNFTLILNISDRSIS